MQRKTANGQMSTTSDDCQMRELISLESKSSADKSDLQNSKIDISAVDQTGTIGQGNGLRAIFHAIKKETDQAKQKRQCDNKGSGSISDRHSNMEESGSESESDVIEMDEAKSIQICESKKVEFQDCLNEELLISHHDPNTEQPNIFAKMIQRQSREKKAYKPSIKIDVMPCCKKRRVEEHRPNTQYHSQVNKESPKTPKKENNIEEKKSQEKVEPLGFFYRESRVQVMPCLKKNVVLEKVILKDIAEKAIKMKEESAQKEDKALECQNQTDISSKDLRAEIIPERCEGGNPIKKVCIEHKCNKDAFLCNSKACQKCGECHSKCKLSLTAEVFVSAINDNFDRQLTIQKTAFECEERIIRQIRENRSKRAKLAYFQGVQSTMMHKLEQRYAQRWQMSVKSNQVLEILQAIGEEESVLELRELNLIEKLTSQQKAVSEILQDQMKVILEKTELVSTRILKSSLVTAKEDIKFVLEQINCPRKLRLLYRASEHEFSIPKFHQLCDSTCRTLTLYKTQFGRLIGGYTPVSWSDKFGRDRSNKSFLMNISLKERLEHKSHGESAVYCRAECGPSFGGFFQQRDLQIRQHGGVLFCSTSFPSAYNWKQFFNSGQESWRFLTGVERGQECRILDMEVFEVVPRD